ncbi:MULTISPECIES: phosphoethanolamine transferase [unclassified Massilia]|uniref:phosphoethanolamine transferase n=1 Tax=unclassified Massilia TaxID=2609279 RepID=UPI00177AB189|nr:MULTISPECIES: phosphoethanolamine transferase [unclassified Massilia]MBD8530997.1 phosphoethanolamine transferase [Massilia sp. CFBP 13647]MBD8674590.1 phosphoethanolamine transferase [Massilia sp. CFBP 13721]
MRTLPRPAHLALVLTYLVLSAVPFFPLTLGLPLARPAQLAGMAVFAWIAVWAVFKRPAYFHWLLLPTFIALPAELYLYAYYGQGISTHHLGIMAETSPLEAMEFLGARAWLMLAVMVGVVAWWAGTWRIALTTRDFDWNDRSRPLVLGLVIVAAALFAYGQKVGVTGAPAKPDPAAKMRYVASATPLIAPSTLPPLPHWTQPPFEVKAFAQSWPFGVVARGLDFYKERVYLADLHRRSAAFRFDAVQADPANTPDVIVMVLGESARFDRWSVNGYARPTNPLLSQEPNLISMSDLITSVSATRLSVPVIISRKRAMQSLKDGFTEKSFLTAFKEAGYKTYWLSNQISFGKFDTPVSVFAKEADTVEFLNLGGFTDNSNYDEVLFKPFARALADPAPKKLIVLHTLGSHWNYAHRYPARFDQWKPSLVGVHKPVLTDTSMESQLNNSYDNSILYTDWFLAQLVAQLKTGDRAAALMYVADHGQTLFDGACRQVFHGHNNQHEFHVPAFAWYSDAYGARFPDKVAQLRAHRTAPLSTENMFHTLVDLGDIRYPGETLERSIASAQLTRHKRYVDSYGWADYDNANIKGDCREVIDKGTPLLRK